MPRSLRGPGSHAGSADPEHWGPFGHRREEGIIRALVQLGASLALAFCLTAVPASADTSSVASGAQTAFRLLHLEQTLARWHAPAGKPITVTYAFVDRTMNFPGARNCKGMQPLDSTAHRNGFTAAELAREMAAAARQWQDVADIRFQPVRDTATAKLLIGAQTQPVGRAFTNVELTEKITGHPRSIARALICLNPQQPWKIGFDGDLDRYDLRYTLAHEIGHAIGLDHPGAAGQLMAYRYTEDFAGLQPGDVAGAIALYGKPAKRSHASAPPAGSTVAEKDDTASPQAYPHAQSLGLGQSAPGE